MYSGLGNAVPLEALLYHQWLVLWFLGTFVSSVLMQMLPEIYVHMQTLFEKSIEV